MNYIINILSIKIRLFLKSIKKGYRYYNQSIDFSEIIDKNFKENKRFSFVQVGANDGISFDNLFEIVKKREAIGIVIEPIKEYYDQLVLNYADFPKIKTINQAVHPFKTHTHLFKVAKSALYKYPDWAKGIASIDPRHHLKANIETVDIIKDEVVCETLMNIIKINGDISPDYLQIDTEGFDFEVIKMIDFSLIKPAIIKFESINLSQTKKKNANELLESNNYQCFKKDGDTVAINLHKIRLFWK